MKRFSNKYFQHFYILEKLKKILNIIIFKYLSALNYLIFDIVWKILLLLLIYNKKKILNSLLYLDP